MSTIDPTKINPLIEMVNDMLRENAELIEGLESGVEDCELTFNKSEAAYLLAKKELEAADDALDKAASEFNRLKKVASEKVEAEKTAQMDSNLAEANKQSKITNLDNETARIQAEDDTLKEVRQMINDINKPELISLGRNILSFDIKSLLDADPQSITELLELIDGLIKAGEADLQFAKDELTKATNAAALAKQALATAVEQRQIADGAAIKQNELVENLADEVGHAEVALSKAAEAMSDDRLVWQKKEESLAAKRKVVEEEEKEMKEIIRLLETVKD